MGTIRRDAPNPSPWGAGEWTAAEVPPNSVTPILWVISLALATCSHHPVMWAAGIINPSHELILPPNTSGRIEAPPPPPLQERKKRLQLSQAFPSLQECQRHTPAIVTLPPCTRACVPELHGITEEAETPGGRSNSAAHEICGPQQANDPLLALTFSSLKRDRDACLPDCLPGLLCGKMMFINLLCEALKLCLNVEFHVPFHSFPQSLH